MITITLPNGTSISGDKEEVIEAYKELMDRYDSYRLPDVDRYDPYQLPDDYQMPPYLWKPILTCALQ